MHLHVLDTRLAVDAVCRGGCEVVAAEPVVPYLIIVVARKPIVGIAASRSAEHRLTATLRNSPFPTDRQVS